WRPHITADDIVDRILAHVEPGDVIVLHDGERTSQRDRVTCLDREVVAVAVRTLVPALTTRGFRVVPLYELLRVTPPTSGVHCAPDDGIFRDAPAVYGLRSSQAST